MNLIIAWRNIWRNKKRTFITISSIVLAVILAVFTRSFQEGTYSQMIANSIGQMTGYVNIHNKDYWADKSLDNGMEITNDFVEELKKSEGVTAIDKKIESFALVSNEFNTKGSLVIGISPQEEDKHVNLSGKIIEGKMIEDGDKSILLGSRLAKYLKIEVGDTLVMMGQGHFGNSAISAYPVKGIVKIPSPEIDRQIVYMPLKLAQEYFSFPDGVTTLIVRFEEQGQADEICKSLNSRIDSNLYKAMTWREMSPELVQMIEGDKAGGVIMIVILYMIIAFGIIGTVLMMTEERKKEFGMMIALGMRKSKLLIITIYEMVLINGIGLTLGSLLTLPIIIYYRDNPIRITGEMAKSVEQFGMEPIMPTLVDIGIFKEQVFTIGFIIIVAAIYPIFTIIRLNLIKALRH